ncbi:hypothetical protein ACFQ0K_09925 [Nocardioides caeni]|uniref:AAA+ ATPase domain-containing protein n=1 Tax=Nocardioides caeni TaxID=574700 RepID=A0A4S8N8E9_9ACTN|nr:hypothetical protein [Nocardioides caeni]THV11209.1 hypothetical protein E9934_13035 [Nocardioides caeni]
MGTVHLHPRSSGGRPSLVSFADDLEDQRYECPGLVARRRELLLDDSSLRILVLSGPGGSGKSAALRSIGREARRLGQAVSVVDARAQDVAAELDALADAPARVVLVDEVDLLPGGLTGLAAAIQALPADTRLVLAGRGLPARWLPSALESLTAHVRVPALTPDAADRVLLAHAVDDADVRGVLVRWAGGLPLALVVGARAWAAAGSRPDRLEAALLREGSDDLLAHLAGSAFDELEPELVAALAVAPGLDAALIGHLFPGRTEEVVATLRATGVVESVAGRIALHPTLAEVLADRLRSEEPARLAATTLRVAGHEHSRALLGDPGAVARLAALVRDPALRSGLGSRTPAPCYADRWRPDDAPAVRRRVEAACPGAWSLVGAWAGADLRVVRRADGAVAALVAAMSVRAAERLTGPRRQLIAPVLERARSHGEPERAVITAVQLTVDGSGDPEVDRVRNAAGLAQCGIANPRSDWANLVGDRPAERDVLRAYGYEEVVDLRRTVAGVPVSTWFADTGPGGLAGLLHDAILQEQGGSGGVVEPGLLLAVLEAFDDDAALARLAAGTADLVRSGDVGDLRAWVHAHVTRTLAGEPALLDLIQRRYLTAGGTHESVMRATFLSRATYFRRLRRARDLLVR